MEHKKILHFFGLFVVITICISILMLSVDPYYFDYQLGTALAGLDSSQAPSNKFTTSVTFRAKSGEPILLLLGAREKETKAQVDVIDPDGKYVFRDTFQIPKPPSINFSRKGWRKVYFPSFINGTYTIYITQEEPTYIKLYIFQGPFILRLVMLPLFSIILIFAFYAIKKAKQKQAKQIALK